MAITQKILHMICILVACFKYFTHTTVLCGDARDKRSLSLVLSRANHTHLIVHKLKSNCNTKLSNLSKEEWTALINLKNRNDLVIKAADKGGATVVWRTDLYQQEAIRQLSDPTFYTKVNKDLTPANQKIVKDTKNS